MKTLRIYCKNCDNDGMIDHPEVTVCPFCDGEGSKDIEYGEGDLEMLNPEFVKNPGKVLEDFNKLGSHKPSKKSEAKDGSI